jgi:alternate signal-mediated exported protein
MKSKKSLIAIITLVLVAIVGVTFAYFQSNASFVNIFNTGTYRVVTTEEFVGPENWAPGQEIPKTITSTNEGTIPAAVRASITEQWIKEIDGVETDITNQITNGTVIINLDNTSDWIQEGNYYYYKYILEPGDTTKSFIKSVTLNPNMNGATCVASQDGLTQTCESNNPALGATYKLTITKETVQADKYQEVWNTNVEITEKTLITGEELCYGEENEECLTVFETYEENGIKYAKLLTKYDIKEVTDSNTNEKSYIQSENDYDRILFPSTGWVRTVDGVEVLGEEYTNGGEYSFNPNTYGFEDSQGNSVYPYVYKTCSLVEGYISDLKSKYGLPESIVGRLATYYEIKNAPADIKFNNTEYWTGSAQDRTYVYFVPESNYDSSPSTMGISSLFYMDHMGIRPMIIVPIADIA